ncbi:MAG: EamA family transporter, partial [Pseudomonadota bacterium]
ELKPSLAAVAQLTVPLIAMAGGMIFLAEPLTARFVIASVIVLGGVAYAVVTPRR